MEEDADLAQWRAQRMAQMRAGAAPGSQQQPSEQELELRRKQQEAQQEQRRIILNQIMTSDAREKLANIRLVKPERAQQVETYLINSAQGGQLRGKINEEQVKDILRSLTEQTQKRTKVTIMRRKPVFDEDDDDDDDDF
ncbi:Double-stranded DNA-binding protein [Gracilaria domingensis]|nr:Double-stranded DNA-binding protein [Gracilaria domingensis]